MGSKIQNANLQFSKLIPFGKTINRNFLFIWSIKNTTLWISKSYISIATIPYCGINCKWICESQRFYIFKEEIEAKITNTKEL
jgi:hypothetical protein